MVTKTMQDMFRPTDLAAVSICKEEDALVVAELDDILSKRSTKFIAGDNQPGVADIALASLFAPLVCPSQYAYGVYFKWFKLIEE
jgi:hypothetical protein